MIFGKLHQRRRDLWFSANAPAALTRKYRSLSLLRRDLFIRLLQPDNQTLCIAIIGMPRLGQTHHTSGSKASKATPTRSSNLDTWRLTWLVLQPSCFAAAEKPWHSATATNSLIPSKLSILHLFTSNEFIRLIHIHYCYIAIMFLPHSILSLKWFYY